MPVALHGFCWLAITFSLWWLYFDDVAGAHIRPGRWTTFVWLYSHLPVAAGLVAFSVGSTKLLPSAADPLTVHDGRLMGGAVAVHLIFVALIDLVTVRADPELSNAVWAYWHCGAAALVLLSSTLASLVYAALRSAICASQVVVDVSLKPPRGVEVGKLDKVWRIFRTDYAKLGEQFFDG
jgi:low temperature requirement protein LtrA